MKIIAYQRTRNSPWVACPRTTSHAAQRFALLGVWECLQVELHDGVTLVISDRDQLFPRKETSA